MSRSQTAAPRAFMPIIVLTIVCMLPCSQAAAHTYEPGWFYDTWEITGGPPNTGYRLEGHHWKCGWQRIHGVGSVVGMTDANGNDSGWLLRLVNGIGLQPYHDAVRVRFANGTRQRIKVVDGWGYNANMQATPA